MEQERPYKDVGERILDAYKKRGFANVDEFRDALAADPDGARVSTSAISRWFNGRSLPTRYRDLIERVLNVDYRQLRWGPSGKPPQGASADQDEIAAAVALLQKRGFDVKAKKPPATSEVREVSGRHKQQHPKGTAKRKRA